MNRVRTLYVQIFFFVNACTCMRNLIKNFLECHTTRTMHDFYKEHFSSNLCARLVHNETIPCVHYFYWAHSQCVSDNSRLVFFTRCDIFYVYCNRVYESARCGFKLNFPGNECAGASVVWWINCFRYRNVESLFCEDE